MDNRITSHRLQPVTGMQGTQHLAVDQIECTLPGSQPRCRFMRVIIRMITGSMVVQYCDRFMGMSGGMTQRVRQRALLSRQQQQCQHPAQSDGTQGFAE